MLRRNSLACLAAGIFSMMGSAAFAQSAPPLTSVQITEVNSTLGGLEYISASATTTLWDHGGAQVRVKVREIGYAQTARTVTLNGAIVSNTAVSTTNLCGTASSPSTSCSAGQTVIGFDRVYQIDGQSGGTYSVTARNNRTPFNAITDTLVIK